MSCFVHKPKRDSVYCHKASDDGRILSHQCWAVATLSSWIRAVAGQLYRCTATARTVARRSKSRCVLSAAETRPLRGLSDGTVPVGTRLLMNQTKHPEQHAEYERERRLQQLKRKLLVPACRPLRPWPTSFKTVFPNLGVGTPRGVAWNSNEVAWNV